MLESALIIIPLFAILCAIIDFSMAIFICNSLVLAVREGARYAVTGQIGYGGAGCQDASIKNVVPTNAMGALSGATGLAKVQINYFDPATGADVSAASNSNAGGHVVRVSVAGVNWLWMLSGMWENVNAMKAGAGTHYSGLTMGAASSDIMEAPSWRNPPMPLSTTVDSGVKMPSYSAKRKKGTAILEFGIIISVLIPLMFGTIAFGVNLGNMLQSAQITRDVAHMYAQNVDFSTTANKNLAVSLVQGLGGMTVSGGDGVLILSQVRKVYLANCTTAGLSSGQCTNLNARVFSNRIVIGDITERTSNFGTPNGACTVSSDGNISSAYYLKQAGCVASNFDDNTIIQADGDIAYVVESYFATPNLSFLNGSWSGGAGNGGTAGTYMRAIF